MIMRHIDGMNSLYAGDGKRNEDWWSWRASVLAPFDGTVSAIRINPVTNQPGTRGEPPASTITIVRDDGVHVLFAHIMDVAVQLGQVVSAGQPLACVGNNDHCWNPHLHIGAWRDEQPLQIRFDLRVAGHLLKARAAKEPN